MGLVSARDDARRALPPALVAEIDAIVAEGMALREVRNDPQRKRAWRGQVTALLLERLGLPEDQPRAETLTAEQRAAVVLLSTDDALVLSAPLPTSALARRRWIGIEAPSIFEEEVEGEPRWLRYQRLWREKREEEIGTELPPERRLELLLEQKRGSYGGTAVTDEELANMIAASTPLAPWVRAQDLPSWGLSPFFAAAAVAVAIADGGDLPPSFDTLIDLEAMGGVDPVPILRAIPAERREAVVLASIARSPWRTLRIAKTYLPIFDLPRVAQVAAAQGPKPPSGLDSFEKKTWTKHRDALLALVDRYPVLSALAPRAGKPRSKKASKRAPSESADPLHDPDAFEALSPEERSTLAARIGEALGDDFAVAVGPGGTIDAVAPHVATTFHLIPGGRLRVGISERDVEALEGTVSSRALHVAHLRMKEATPVREVTIAPFLVSDAIDGEAQRTRVAALASAKRAKMRLPSEVELEYLLREGRSEQAFSLQNDDGDGPDDSEPHGRRHRWGVGRVLEACWAADDWHDNYLGAPMTAEPWGAGGDEGVLRSGFGVGMSQGKDELVFALAGLRIRGGATGDMIGDLEPCLRLAIDLPPLSAPDAPRTNRRR